MKFKIVMVVAMFCLLLCGVMGCSNKDSDLLGRWQSTDGKNFIEFVKEGKSFYFQEGEYWEKGKDFGKEQIYWKGKHTCVIKKDGTLDFPAGGGGEIKLNKFSDKLTYDDKEYIRMK